MNSLVGSLLVFLVLVAWLVILFVIAKRAAYEISKGWEKEFKERQKRKDEGK